MKTIVFLIDGLLNSGGTERLTVVTANNLALSGYNIHIITLRESSKHFSKLIIQLMFQVWLFVREKIISLLRYSI